MTFVWKKHFISVFSCPLSFVWLVSLKYCWETV